VKALLIARREPQSHLNGAPGLWWAEYRLVRVTPEDRCAPDRPSWVDDMREPFGFQMRYAHEQDSEYCQVHQGVWQRYCEGSTPVIALDQFGDSAFNRATSLHESHALILQMNQVQALIHPLARETDEPAVAKAKDALKDEAQAYFEVCLKRRKIHSAASRGEAPPAKVALAQAEAKAWYAEEKRKAVAVLSEQRDHLARLRIEMASLRRRLEESLSSTADWEEVSR